MFTFYKRYLEGNHCFHCIIVVFFCFCMISLVNCVWLIYFYGKTEYSNGLYMNLTPFPDNGTCDSYPFDEYYPLEFEYITENGKYHYSCPPPKFYFEIGHTLVSSLETVCILFVFFAGAIFVHWSVIPGCICLILVNSIVFSCGITDLIITKQSLNYCQNELFSLIDFSNSTIQPVSFHCKDSGFKQYASFETFTGIILYVYVIFISILYFILRKKKITDNNQYKQQETSSQSLSDNNETQIEINN